MDFFRVVYDKDYVCKMYFLIMCLKEKGIRGVEIIFVKWKCFFCGVWVSKILVKKIVLVLCSVYEIKYFEFENLY